jgi:retron-type reverse transcriptase
MQVFRDLYPQVCSFENLYQAYRKARRGKRGKASVSSFECNQEEELWRLHDELRSHTWQPGQYHNFTIHDPKRRLISAAPFRDRVVHHALCNFLEPIWERLFIADSYANRKGKGTHKAILRCNEFARQYRYILQCDVEQFFPSIDHQVLYSILVQRLDDPQTCSLIQKIIQSGQGVQQEVYQMRWFPGDDLWAAARPRGLPIGNLTSQFWANVYLNGFDHFVKRELSCPAYVRYVDDFALFADDKATLWRWKEAIVERLSRLRLVLHEPQVYPVSTGIPFLGFRIYPDHRLLKKRRGIVFQRRFHRLYLKWAADEISRQRLDAAARSWAAHASWGKTRGLREKVLGRYLLRP